MRADRLLRVLLLLQTRGRMTAGALAQSLEVSVRTVQRDMSALSSAGIPVYAERGGAGGWQLVDGFRTTLTGLTPAEALAIAVGRPDSVLRDLGIDSTEAGLLKVLASMPELAQQAAEHARQRVHVDLEPWGATPGAPSPMLRTLYAAISSDVAVRISYGGGGTFEIAPLGLVAKGLAWYVVAKRASYYRTYRVSRIQKIEPTSKPIDRPPSFDLASHWRHVSTNVGRTFPSFRATLRVDDAALARLRWTTRDLHIEDPGDGAHRVRVDLETESEAVSVVLSLGAGVIVERPKRLRMAVAATGSVIARDNSF
jgi:predicted DNA-binding transcriptional regulator YafY